MKETCVKIVNHSRHELPSYETLYSAGMDVRALMEFPLEKVILSPGKRVIIGTGLHVAVPDGYEIQVRSRSGLAAKSGIMVLNSPGTIDSDYRGEIKVILLNTSQDDTHIVRDGDRIAQLVLSEKPRVRWEVVEELPESVRGIGGLGSTGVK